MNFYFKINPKFYPYLSNKFLYLIILPTEACNFKCIYCYEKFRPGLMGQGIVEAIKRFLAVRIGELNRLKIDWFGGEPLIAYNIIVDVMKFVNDYSQKANPDLIIEGEVTTNGYLLTIDRLRELAKLKVKYYQVTFDGDKGFHDKVRIRIKGLPTFETIWNNVINAHNSSLDFEMVIRIHLHRDNMESVKSLLKKFADMLRDDERFLFHIRSVSRLGGLNDDKVYPVSDNVVNEVKEYARLLGLKLFELPSPYICYASWLNSFIIMPDGTLSKCTVRLYDDVNKVGKINNDGTLTVDEDKLLWWARGIINNDLKTAACPAFKGGSYV
ncbi:MAG: radical SAM protein [Vulcanisaeta sp.]